MAIKRSFSVKNSKQQATQIKTYIEKRKNKDEKRQLRIGKSKAVKLYKAKNKTCNNYTACTVKSQGKWRDFNRR